MNFHDFGLDKKVIEAIEAMQFDNPTPVQQQVMPEIIAGHDLIACAQTGTGKTAAFLIPIIHKLLQSPNQEKLKALVIVPTRELAVQISQHMEGFSYFAGTSSLAIYGGGTGMVYSNEKKALTSGVDMVVCTPGRMISHLNLGYVDLTGLDFLVLDEADRMLDMGFFDDIMKIISYMPVNRQSLLFSATMPAKIRELGRKILKKPKEINIGLSAPPEQIRQEAYVVFDEQKPLLVDQLIRDENMKSILVFSDTKVGVKQLSKSLRSKGFPVEEIHSDLQQSEREAVMNRFKSKQLRILVATDIISRGIDVEDIDLVINYNVPHDAEDYVHRIGRTARAGAHGKACTLIGPHEQRKFASIEKLLGKEVEKSTLPANMGETPAYDPGKYRPDNRYDRHSGAGYKRNKSKKRPFGKKRVNPSGQ